MNEEKSHEPTEPLLSRIRNVNPIIAILLILGVGIVIFSCLFSALFLGSNVRPLTVRIIYPGDWNGAIEDESGAWMVSGPGNDNYSVKGRDVAAIITKLDDSEIELTVQILRDGEVVASESTALPNGTVSISYSF